MFATIKLSFVQEAAERVLSKLDGWNTAVGRQIQVFEQLEKVRHGVVYAGSRLSQEVKVGSGTGSLEMHQMSRILIETEPADWKLPIRRRCGVPLRVGARCRFIIGTRNSDLFHPPVSYLQGLSLSSLFGILLYTVYLNGLSWIGIPVIISKVRQVQTSTGWDKECWEDEAEQVPIYLTRCTCAQI
ncbi:hypothetical protein F5Y04DRAFT_97150 [Hypomontagnella monticulosa]|nr:hypothetical protein F5Y04DRAFT_97150 [Hypomontagnella monticulosa]